MMKFQTKEIATILKSTINKNERIKFSEDSIALTGDYLEMFVYEALARMGQIAMEGEELNLSHLEKVLPQLMLDFF